MAVNEKIKGLFKVSTVLVLLVFSTSSYGSDYYITKSDLNLREGSGVSSSVIEVIKKGDTVILHEDSGKYWVKIQYGNLEGYAAKEYLLQIEPPKELEVLVPVQNSVVEGVGSSYFPNFMILTIINLIIGLLIKEISPRNRNKSFATFIAFFFGIFGYQKFYLGRTEQGIYSIMFCWTFIPIITGIVDYVKLEKMSDEEFDEKFNRNNQSKPKSSMKANNQVHNSDSKINETSKASKVTQKPDVSYYLKWAETHNQDFMEESRLNFFKTRNMAEQSKIDYTPEKSEDPSIIDVGNQDIDLKIEHYSDIKKHYTSPPFWSNRYIYSYGSINDATREQKEFYYYLRKEVLEGNYVNIHNNTNYAFILYFDLLSSYHGHKDIKLLDKQFKLLIKICPKTRSYALDFLQTELKKRTDSYSKEKLEKLENPSYQFEQGYLEHDPYLYRLGSQYQEKLGLTFEETNWLNKFQYYANTFSNIEGSCIAIIKQYLLVLKEFNGELKKNDSSLDEEIKYFNKELKSSRVNGYNDTDNFVWSYYNNFSDSQIYLIIFKRVENYVRDSFGHSRKVSEDLKYIGGELSDEFENRIGKLLQEINEKHKDKIGPPDFDTQIILNSYNVNRWKLKFSNLKKTFKKERLDDFIDGIMELEETNQKNPNIENIFFEASKFIVRHDEIQSLKYYAKYIYYDLKSKQFDKKELAKTVQKSLFKTEQQIEDFKEIIYQLIETSDIQTTLDRISKIYFPKRKRIELNHSEIEETIQKHEGTVELLNQYLGDDESKETVVTRNENFSKEEVEVIIAHANGASSIFVPEVQMESVQTELIKKIINNSYRIDQTEVDRYATENGVFKNQLIDSINEACMDSLDGEVLIEEEDDHYIIEESYYKEILKIN